MYQCLKVYGSAPLCKLRQLTVSICSSHKYTHSRAHAHWHSHGNTTSIHASVLFFAIWFWVILTKKGWAAAKIGCHTISAHLVYWQWSWHSCTETTEPIGVLNKTHQATSVLTANLWCYSSGTFKTPQRHQVVLSGGHLGLDTAIQCTYARTHARTHTHTPFITWLYSGPLPPTWHVHPPSHGTLNKQL